MAGIIDKVAAIESARQVAKENAAVAEYAKQQYAEGLAAQQAAEQQANLVKAKELGKYEMLDNLRAAQLVGQVVQPVRREPRFAQPVMRDALDMQPEPTFNQYQGGLATKYRGGM